MIRLFTNRHHQQTTVAHRQGVGKSIHQDLQAVEQHLSVCAEYREEYEALRRTPDEANGRPV